MKLGENECAYDIAYFMENGEYPKPNYSKKHSVKASYDDCLEREEQYRDIDYNNYFEWQYEKTYRYCLYK